MKPRGTETLLLTLTNMIDDSGDPRNILSQFYLGETLFREERYAAAVLPFEEARGLENWPYTGSLYARSSGEERAKGKQLTVQYTFPVDVSGLPDAALNVMRDAIAMVSN